MAVKNIIKSNPLALRRLYVRKSLGCYLKPGEAPQDKIFERLPTLRLTFEKLT